MGVVKINNMYDEQRTARGSGKPYMVRVVEGTKVGSNKEWAQPVFMSNKELIGKLSQFGKGECANFVYEQIEKDGREFFDLVDIREPDGEYVEKLENGEVIETRVKADTGGYKKSSNGNKGGSNLTKEEWAEKDRKAKIGMSIHNSIAAASRVCKAGTKPDALVEYAKALLPYMMLSELPEDEVPWDTGDDGLEPPVED